MPCGWWEGEVLEERREGQCGWSKVQEVVRALTLQGPGPTAGGLALTSRPWGATAGLAEEC